MRKNTAVVIMKIAVAILTFNLYSWHRAIELMAAGAAPIKVIIFISILLSVRKVNSIYVTVGKIINFIGSIYKLLRK